MKEKCRYYIRVKKKHGPGHGYLYTGETAEPPWVFSEGEKTAFASCEEACAAARKVPRRLAKISASRYDLGSAEIIKKVTTKTVEQKIYIGDEQLL